MTEEQALKLALEAMAWAFRIAEAFGQRQAFKAALRKEMAAMFAEAEGAIEHKHRRDSLGNPVDPLDR